MLSTSRAPSITRRCIAPQNEAPFRAMSLQTICWGFLGRSGAALVAIAGFLLVFNWWVALVLIIGELAGSLVRIRGAAEQYQWYRRTNHDLVRASYFSSLLTAGTFIPKVRLFGLGGLFVERARRLRERLQHEHQQIVLRRMGADMVMQVSAVAAVYGAFSYVRYQTLTGSITLGDLVMYFAAFQRSQGYLHDILIGLASFYEDNLFLTHISEFLALAPTVRQQQRPVPVPRPLNRYRAGACENSPSQTGPARAGGRLPDRTAWRADRHRGSEWLGQDHPDQADRPPF